MLRDIQKRGRLVSVDLSPDGLGHQRPQLIDVDDGAVEFVHGLVEVPHTDLAKVPGMVLVEENTMVVHTSSVTTTSRMLAVLAHTTVSGTHMASLLAILLQAGRHGCCSNLRSTLQSNRSQQLSSSVGKRNSPSDLSRFGQTLTMPPRNPNERSGAVGRTLVQPTYSFVHFGMLNHPTHYFRDCFFTTVNVS